MRPREVAQHVPEVLDLRRAPTINYDELQVIWSWKQSREFNCKGLTRLVGIADNSDAATRCCNSPHELVLYRIRVLAARRRQTTQAPGWARIRQSHSQLVHQYVLAPFPHTRVLLKQTHSKQQQVVKVEAVALPELAFVALVDVRDDLKDVDVLEQGTCSSVLIVIASGLGMATLSIITLFGFHAEITSMEFVRGFASRLHFRDQGHSRAFREADVLVCQELRMVFQQLLDDLLAVGGTEL